MQAISPALTAACSATGQTPCAAVEVSWTDTGLITASRGAAGWTDESAYLVRHSGDIRINPPGERLVAAGEVGSATVVLDNTSNRFSWMRSDGPLYAYIGGAAGLAGKAIRIYEGYVTASGQELVRVFTGVIASWRETPEATVELSCKDWGFRYFQDRRSTAVVRDKRPDEWIEIVAGLLGIGSPLMDLDIGIYQIPWLWMDDESAVEEMWEAAESDGGLAWFNQNGLLLYRNALAWTGLSSVWTFDEGTYSLPDPEIDISPVATKIRVDWSGRLPGPDTTLYTLDTYKVILPAQSISWTARFNHAATAVSTPTRADPYNDYFAVSGGGLDMTAKLTVTLSNIYGQQCQVTIANTSTTQTARLVAFKLRGQPLLGGPTEQVNVDVSPAPFSFERLRSEAGNSYCQTEDQGRALANLLALRGQRVRPIWTLLDVPGLPHLELGDLVAFRDNRGLGSGQTVYGLIIGVAWEAGQGTGFVQRYRLMDVTDLAEYTNYFEIGTSKLGEPVLPADPETGYGRLFY